MLTSTSPGRSSAPSPKPLAAATTRPAANTHHARDRGAVHHRGTAHAPASTRMEVAPRRHRGDRGADRQGQGHDHGPEASALVDVGDGRRRHPRQDVEAEEQQGDPAEEPRPERHEADAGGQTDADGDGLGVAQHDAHDDHEQRRLGPGHPQEQTPGHTLLTTPCVGPRAPHRRQRQRLRHLRARPRSGAPQARDGRSPRPRPR